MLSLSHNFLFIHIPKTAGNSIQDALRQYSDDSIVCLGLNQDGIDRFGVKSEKYNTSKHSSFMDYEREYGSGMMAKLFKFTCIRNPWDRCMSHFFSSHRGSIAWDKSRFLHFMRSEVKPLTFYLARDLNEPLHRAVDNVDYIVRHEFLERDFQRVCERIGESGSKLAHRNISPVKDHRRYYDNETIDAVRNQFSEEIEFFNYSF